MSTKEKIYSMIDGFTEEQLQGLLTMLTGYNKIIAEAEDDAFCAKLYEEAKNDDRSDAVSAENFARELGVDIA